MLKISEKYRKSELGNGRTKKQKLLFLHIPHNRLEIGLETFKIYDMLD